MIRDIRRMARTMREAQKLAEDVQAAAAAIKTISNEAVETFDHLVETGKKIKKKAVDHLGGKAAPVVVPNHAIRQEDPPARAPKSTRRPDQTREAIEVRDENGNTLYVVR